MSAYGNIGFSSESMEHKVERSFHRIREHPQSNKSHQEEELANQSLRQLQSGITIEDPVERLRLLCLSRGPHGLMGLGRLFRKMDEDGNKTINKEEFTQGLRNNGFDVSDEEINALFVKFDVDDSGSIDIHEFFTQVKPPLSESRQQIIQKAFSKMDKTGEGEILLKDLRRAYNVQNNPWYVSGEMDRDEILDKFLIDFAENATREGKVTLEEFLNYYTGVSGSIDSDCYFDLMMRQAYKL